MQEFAFFMLVFIFVALTLGIGYFYRELLINQKDDSELGIFIFFLTIYVILSIPVLKYLVIWGYPVVSQWVFLK